MKSTQSRILVTGASGFLGSHIADALSDIGHKVTLFDINPSPYKRDDQDMIVGDITDAKIVSDAIKDHDYVYHFAALADIDDAKFDPRKTMEINIMGTLNILEACVEHRIKRVLFASTIYVYSNSGSFYRVSKHSCELLLQNYQKEKGLEYSILRFGTLYGPRSDRHNSIYRILTQALEKKQIEHKGTGEEVREYIHVKDAARVSALALKEEFANEALIVTGHHRIKLKSIHQTVNEILGNSLSIVYHSEENQSHYNQTPYSYLPKLGKKLISTTYHDLGQGLIEVLAEIENPEAEEIKL